MNYDDQQQETKANELESEKVQCEVYLVPLLLY